MSEWTTAKGGWLYEKQQPTSAIGAIANFLKTNSAKKWKPRWTVLYSDCSDSKTLGGDRKSAPAIAVYEQRSDASPPYAPIRRFMLTADTVVRTSDGSVWTAFSSEIHLQDDGSDAHSIVCGTEQSSKSRTRRLLGWLSRSNSRASVLSTSRPASIFESPMATSVHGKMSGKGVGDLGFSIVIPAAAAESGKSALTDSESSASGMANHASGMKSTSSATTLHFTAPTRAERDEWVHQLQRVISSLASSAMCAADEKNAMAAAVEAASHREAAEALLLEAESIRCAGSVIVHGSVVHQLRDESLAGVVQLPKTAIPMHRSSTDSIVSEMTASQEDLVKGEDGQNNEAVATGQAEGARIPEESQLKEIHREYQQTCADRSRQLQSKSNSRDILRLDLRLMTLMGQFNDIVVRRAVAAVDDLIDGRGSPIVTSGTSRLVIRIIGGGGMQTLSNKSSNHNSNKTTTASAATMDEQAVQAANHWLQQELLAMRWLSSRTDLHVPLTSVVDYKGFRVLARYDPPNLSGIPLKDAETVMRRAAIALNMQPLCFAHENQLNCTSAEQGNELSVRPASLPASVELYCEMGGVLDGLNASNNYSTSRVYALNVHGIVPQYQDGDALDDGSCLYLRPELISSLNSPFCPSDAALNANETTCSKNQMTVDVAHQVMLDRIDELVADLHRLDVLLPTPSDWTRLLHQRGINVSRLGLIASKSSLPHVVDGAVCEMVARMAKVLLRVQLRAAVSHLKSVQAQNIGGRMSALVSEALNAMFSVQGLSSGATGSSLVMVVRCSAEIAAMVKEHFGYEEGVRGVLGASCAMLRRHVFYHCNLEMVENYDSYVPANCFVDKESILSMPPRIHHCFEPVDQLDGFGDVSLGDLFMKDFAMEVLALGSANVWEDGHVRSRGARSLVLHVREKLEQNASKSNCDYAGLMGMQRLLECAAGMCPRWDHFTFALILIVLGRLRLELARICVLGSEEYPILKRRLFQLGSLPSSTSRSMSEKDQLGGMERLSIGGGASEQWLGEMESISGAVGLMISRLVVGSGTAHVLVAETQRQLAHVYEICAGLSAMKRTSTRALELALTLRRSVLEIALKVLGRRHETTGLYYFELGVTLMSVGDYEAAIGVLGEALLCSMINVTIEAQLMLKLAECWQNKGDFEPALEWAEKANALDRSASGQSSRKSEELLSAETSATVRVREWGKVDLFGVVSVNLTKGVVDSDVFERALEMKAKLCERIFSEYYLSSSSSASSGLALGSISEVLEKCSKDVLMQFFFGSQNSCGSSALISGSAAMRLEMAIRSYELLLERSMANASEIKQMMRRIVLLSLCSARPNQRSVLQSALRSFGTTGNAASSYGDERMQTMGQFASASGGGIKLSEHVRMVLIKGEQVQTLEESLRGLHALISFLVC